MTLYEQVRRELSVNQTKVKPRRYWSRRNLSEHYLENHLYTSVNTTGSSPWRPSTPHVYTYLERIKVQFKINNVHLVPKGPKSEIDPLSFWSPSTCRRRPQPLRLLVSAHVCHYTHPSLWRSTISIRTSSLDNERERADEKTNWNRHYNTGETNSRSQGGWLSVVWWMSPLYSGWNSRCRQEDFVRKTPSPTLKIVSLQTLSEEIGLVKDFWRQKRTTGGRGEVVPHPSPV